MPRQKSHPTPPRALPAATSKENKKKSLFLFFCHHHILIYFQPGMTLIPIPNRPPASDKVRLWSMRQLSGSLTPTKMVSGIGDPLNKKSPRES